MIADLAHVAWAVNLGCLGFHVWPAHADDPMHSDELRIDLDPTTMDVLVAWQQWQRTEQTAAGIDTIDRARVQA